MPARANDGGDPPPTVFPGFGALAHEPVAEPSDVVVLLADRRRALGMSQTAVAAHMGTSQSAVARLEAGVDDVRLSTLERYADAVDLRLGYVLGDRD